MTVREEFDQWASEGRDRGMEQRHWHTAKHVLARMPVEPGDTVLDLGCGSGYAGRAYGVDASGEMVRNARSYTDGSQVAFCQADFEHLPFEADSIDHCFSMEAFYYASDPLAALEELHRVLRPGGTVFCAVNFFEESVHTHHWPDQVGVGMTRWSAAEYREAFREAGFHVASQDNVPDREIDIPPAEEFPTEAWGSRDAMVDRYRVQGTLLTVGVVP